MKVPFIFEEDVSMAISLNYNRLLSLPELLSALRLKVPERNELPPDGRHDFTLFSFEEYLALVSRRGSYRDHPIVDRARGVVVSQPMAHTFLPALLVLLDQEIGELEKNGDASQDKDCLFWLDTISRVQKAPVPKAVYPVWRALMRKFLEGGYYIHHGDRNEPGGDRNEPVCICSDSFEPDESDRTIFRILGVHSESHHFGCRTE